MELVPQYYFSNLPPSESKDILQDMINHLSPASAMKEEQKTNDDKGNEQFPQTPTEQRCIIQWFQTESSDIGQIQIKAVYEISISILTHIIISNFWNKCI